MKNEYDLSNKGNASNEFLKQTQDISEAHKEFDKIFVILGKVSANPECKFKQLDIEEIKEPGVSFEFDHKGYCLKFEWLVHDPGNSIDLLHLEVTIHQKQVTGINEWGVAHCCTYLFDKSPMGMPGWIEYTDTNFKVTEQFLRDWINEYTQGIEAK
jgi:hypothetical protein